MTVRIAPGELGQITTRQRGDSWTAQANGRDLGDLKRTVYATGTTEKEARKALKRKWESTTQASGRTLTKRSTIADATELWLTEKQSAVAEQSMALYRNRALNLTLGIGEREPGKKVVNGERQPGRKVINRHGGVGAMELRKVTLGWVRREVFRVQQEHGNAAAWAAYATLRAVLHTAAIHEAIPTNPAAGAISTKDIPTRTDVHALSPDAFKQVWAALEAWGEDQPTFRVDKSRLMFLLHLGLLTVTRCGEALALRERDVLEDRIVISGTIVQPPRGPAYRQDWTKTKRRREVKLTPELQQLLDARREVMAPNEAGLFVASRTGKPVPVVNVGRTLRLFAEEHSALLKELNFPPSELTFHVLRRSAATLVRERRGTEAAGSILGHSGTGNVKAYANAPVMVDEDAIDLLSEFLN